MMIREQQMALDREIAMNMQMQNENRQLKQMAMNGGVQQPLMNPNNPYTYG